MPSDQYDSLLKAQLQQLLRDRGLDDQGTAPALRDRLRAADQTPPPPPEEYDEEDDGDEDGDDFLEDEEVEDEEEAASDDPEPFPSDLVVADPGNGLKDGYFQHTVRAGNDLFFGNQDWHEANKEMALVEAQNAGYRYHPTMGKVEFLIDGYSVHYRFPVEKV